MKVHLRKRIEKLLNKLQEHPDQHIRIDAQLILDDLQRERSEEFCRKLFTSAKETL